MLTNPEGGDILPPHGGAVPALSQEVGQIHLGVRPSGCPQLCGTFNTCFWDLFKF